ncbi:hypothetical protein ACHAXS_012094 [Conticribra weissflogii]
MQIKYIIFHMKNRQLAYKMKHTDCEKVRGNPRCTTSLLRFLARTSKCGLEYV